MTTSLRIISRSPAHTRRIGACLGTLLQPGDLLLLQGPFGAGKTTLVQGIAQGLGVRGHISSPSFALVNVYRAGDRQPGSLVYHIDLYRISDPEEALQFGLEEYLSGKGVTVVEWPERAEEVLPSEHARITMTFAGVRTRVLTIEASGERYVQLLKDFESRCCQ